MTRKKPIKNYGAKQKRGGASDTVAANGAPIRSFDRSLPMALLRAREAVMIYFRTLHRHAGITEQQWRTLRALFHSSPIDVGTLAELTYLQKPSLSRILRTLEQRELVERRLEPSDQRRSLISISKRGQALINGEGSTSERQYAEIRTRFGKDRLDQLYRLLQELECVLTMQNGRNTPRNLSKKQRQEEFT